MIYILLGIIAVLLSLIRYHYHQLRLLRQKLSNLEYQVSEAHEALSQAHGVLEKQKEFIQSHLASDENILKVERKRIADDLHDDTVQRLVLVRLRMQQLLYYRIPAQVEAEVNQLQREMNQIIGDIRYLLDDLVHPKFEQQTFTELLQGLAHHLSRALHCKVEFDVRAEQKEFIISSHVKRELYFIIQEVAQNTLKHAFANLLTIKLSWENGLQVIIQDDGQGLLPLGMGKGFGLASIQNRAHAIGAQMSMHNTTPGLIVILEYQQLQ